MAFTRGAPPALVTRKLGGPGSEFEEADDVAARTHVDAHSATVDGRRNALRALLVDVGNPHIGTDGRQAPRNALADAGSATRDHGDSTVEVNAHATTCSQDPLALARVIASHNATASRPVSPFTGNGSPRA